jgi:hypothetical protein
MEDCANYLLWKKIRGGIKMLQIEAIPIRVESKQEIHIPVGSKFLSIHPDDAGTFFLYLLVDTDAPKEPVTIHLYTTEDPLPEEVVAMTYIQSIHHMNYVYHVYAKESAYVHC